NSNLCTTIPNLQLKLGYSCIDDSKLPELNAVSRRFEGIMNHIHKERAPYVGTNAFSHKSGMHIDAIAKIPSSFEHIDPAKVGAQRKMLLSDQEGRQAILLRAQQIEPTLTKDHPLVAELLAKIKQMEFEGYQFEQADASFVLMVKRMLHSYKPFFTLKDFKVIVEEPSNDEFSANAMIAVCVDSEEEITAARGNGPVHALDCAARKALERFYPSLKEMYLSDFKVRVLESEETTASIVRVLIESRDKTDKWTTVGVSQDILQACWIALMDSLEYKLLKDCV
ncbi:MAG: citramalate synthase, partial [Clostridia bacterium]|nr:citramalate synthase [Clostridia bacterium]